MTAQFISTVDAVADGISRAISMNKFFKQKKAIDIDDVTLLIFELEPMPHRREQILGAVKILLEKYGIEILDSKTDPTGERSRA